uniref:Uncharacterized protein n=1 Tax=Acrobeloides nanus TaxID=290746 RepID=A0A914E796_9BILA
MISDLHSLFYLINLLNIFTCIEGCLSTTTSVPTTTTQLCCAPLSVSNPPRISAPTGTDGANLDECAVLRRIQRGECPTTAQIVCSVAKGTVADQVILQFNNGQTEVTSLTGVSRVVGTITCTDSGYQVSVGGTLQAFDSVSCTQHTLQGPDLTDYYNAHDWSDNKRYAGVYAK